MGASGRRQCKWFSALKRWKYNFSVTEIIVALAQSGLFSDGRTAEGDILVDADSIYSKVRASMSNKSYLKNFMNVATSK